MLHGATSLPMSRHLFRGRVSTWGLTPRYASFRGFSSNGQLTRARSLEVSDPYRRFMPADAFWTFAMACNVYLAFFRQYDGSQLRHQEWKYLLACYGIPFVPSFVFLFISTPDRGKIYGNAVVSDQTTCHD